MRHRQWIHVNDILERPLEQSYQAAVIPDFKLEDWVDPELSPKRTIVRSDIRLKNYPYRERPVVPLR